MSVTLPEHVTVLIHDVYVFHPDPALPDWPEDADGQTVPVHVLVRYDNVQIPAWIEVGHDLYRTLQLSGRMFKLKYDTRLRKLLAVSLDAQTYYKLLAEEPVRLPVT